MIARSLSRIVLPSLAVVACGAAAAVYGVQHFRQSPLPATEAAAAAPASAAQNSTAQALKSAQAQAKAVTSALAPPPSAKAAGDVPSFDVARIEPSGDAVIAGRAAPGATVELLRSGKPHDRAVADQSGEFVMVPPRLPPGSYALTLRATRPNGKQALSTESVAVAIAAPSPQNKPGAPQKPVVALMSPDKPTVVLSQPAPANALRGKVAVESVDTAPGGKLFVSGHAPPGATVRLYLNNSFLASGKAAADGHLAFTINGGVKPGNYHVRLDEVASNSGVVRSRAEVPFDVPKTAPTTASVATPAASQPPAPSAAQHPEIATAAATSNQASPSAVVVPKIATTTVVWGDSLWRISRTTYGAGARYAVIYKANRKQIRDPNLIYPGQIFVLPAKTP
ncbi:MAG: LysM peptidoglycan-binding domain-containing protein [Bradyrhizobium sp.]